MFVYLQRSFGALQSAFEWLYLSQVRRSHRRQLIALAQRHIDRLRVSSIPPDHCPPASSSFLTSSRPLSQRLTCPQFSRSPNLKPSSDCSLIDWQLRTVLEDELPNDKLTRNKSLNCAALLTAILAILALVLLCTPCVRYAKQIGRRSLFAIEPFVDYANIYHSRCLIPNILPTNKPKESSLESALRASESVCRKCQEQSEILENLKPIRFVSNVTEETVTWHLKNRLPLFLIDDSVQNWPIAQMKNFENWTEYYEQYGGDRVCMFWSSLPEVADPEEFLENVSGLPSNSSWFAQWENCGKKSKKRMRRLVGRLRSIPPSVEFSSPIWTMLSEGSTSAGLKVGDHPTSENWASFVSRVYNPHFILLIEIAL